MNSGTCRRQNCRRHEVIKQIFAHFDVVIVVAYIAVLVAEIQRPVGNGQHVQIQRFFQLLRNAQAVQGHADA